MKPTPAQMLILRTMAEQPKGRIDQFQKMIWGIRQPTLNRMEAAGWIEFSNSPRGGQGWKLTAEGREVAGWEGA